MFIFRKIWRALFPCNHRFKICPFALLPKVYAKSNFSFINKELLKPKTCPIFFLFLVDSFLIATQEIYQ